jgi:hypothetical protein
MVVAALNIRTVVLYFPLDWPEYYPTCVEQCAGR